MDALNKQSCSRKRETYQILMVGGRTRVIYPSSTALTCSGGCTGGPPSGACVKQL